MKNGELWPAGKQQYGEQGNAGFKWGGAECEVWETVWCILPGSGWEPASTFLVL